MTLALLMACSTAMMAQKTKPTKPNKPATQVAAAVADTLDIKKLAAAASAGKADAQNLLGVCYYTGRKVKKDYTAALKWWSLAAKQNHSEAVANMALCYQYGNGIKQDSLMSVKLYKQSVKMGNVALVKNREKAFIKKPNVYDACLLADIYSYGVGSIKKDAAKSIAYYVKASDAGSLDATLGVARMYESAEKYPEAMKRWTMASPKSDFASYKCGEYLCKGLGTAVDKTKAAAMLKKAANANIPNAQLLLGDLYYKGDGVDRNVAEAVKLYKAVALNGNPAAMWNLGVIYCNGTEVKADYNVGLTWIALAARKGMMNNVQDKLDATSDNGQNGWHGTPLYHYMNGINMLNGNNKDVDAALKCFTALEKRGNKHVAVAIAACYNDAAWKKANGKKKIKYLEEAAAKGDAAGLYGLALCCEKGTDVAADKERALKLFKQSADCGYVPALCHLGNLYNEGKAVNRNLTTAIDYYQRAMCGGYLTREAAVVLADAYEKGLGGLQRNADMAKKVKAMVWTSDPVTYLCTSVIYR